MYTRVENRAETQVLVTTEPMKVESMLYDLDEDVVVKM